MVLTTFWVKNIWGGIKLFRILTLIVPLPVLLEGFCSDDNDDPPCLPHSSPRPNHFPPPPLVVIISVKWKVHWSSICRMFKTNLFHPTVKSNLK